MDDVRIQEGGLGSLPYDEVVFGDTETTGLSPHGLRDGEPTGDPHGPDRLCSAAFLRMRRVGLGWKVVDRLSFLCDPGRPVPETAAKVNGFHWSGDGSVVPKGRVDLHGQAPFSLVSARLMDDFIGDAPLVFHNAVFDAAVLDAELERAGLPLIAVPTLCTKKAFSDIRGLGRPNRYLSGTNLDALCDLLGVGRSSRLLPDGTELHGAMVDAELGGACFSRLEQSGWMLPEDPDAMPHRWEAGSGPRMARARTLALQAWHDEASAEGWLHRPHAALDGREPLDVAAASSVGLDDVETILAGMVHSVAL